MSSVAYGLSHFAVGDFQAFGRSQYPVQPLTDQGAICRRVIPHRTVLPLARDLGVHDRLERRGREKEAVDFPAIHSRENRPLGLGDHSRGVGSCFSILGCSVRVLGVGDEDMTPDNFERFQDADAFQKQTINEALRFSKE